MAPARRESASSSTGAGCGIPRPSESGGSSWFCCLSGRFFGIRASRKGRRHPSRRMLLTKYQNIDSVPGREGRFNSLFGFTALKVKLASFGSACLERDALVTIRLFLNGQNFDPQTTRLVGVAFETARAAPNPPAHPTYESIAPTQH